MISMQVSYYSYLSLQVCKYCTSRTSFAMTTNVASVNGIQSKTINLFKLVGRGGGQRDGLFLLFWSMFLLLNFAVERMSKGKRAGFMICNLGQVLHLEIIGKLFNFQVNSFTLSLLFLNFNKLLLLIKHILLSALESSSLTY